MEPSPYDPDQIIRLFGSCPAGVIKFSLTEADKLLKFIGAVNTALESPPVSQLAKTRLVGPEAAEATLFWPLPFPKATATQRKILGQPLSAKIEANTDSLRFCRLFRDKARRRRRVKRTRTIWSTAII